MSLQVENLLTFGDFHLELGASRSTIVGPNGAGKSNIVRVVDLVHNAVDSVSEGYGGARWNATDQVLRSFASARHHRAPADRPAVVRLAVELTTAAERIQVVTYVRAAILHTVIQDLSSSDRDVRLALAEWAERTITEDAVAALFSGMIVLRHEGMSHVPWQISYEFLLDGVAYSWRLAAPGAAHGIGRADAAAVPTTKAPQPLSERLLGTSRPGSPPLQLPDPLPDFDLARLCPGPDSTVAEPTVRTGTGIIDQELLVFRRAIELLGLPTPETAGQRTFTLAYVLTRILDDGVLAVREQLRGLGTAGSPPEQAGPYPWEALVSPTRGRTPAQLPLRLFELKNGTPDQRTRHQAIQDTFAKLAPGRAVDVTFQATTTSRLEPASLGTGQVAMFSQPAADDQAGPAGPVAVINVVVSRTDGAGSHPDDLGIQLHGAGTWEALVIAEALAEATDRFVILDEPAVTLHPTWQRALRGLIDSTQGQFLIITHSADLVSMSDADDLASLVRVENETGTTRLHRFDAAEFVEDGVARITREFALSTDAVSLLFARGVVLVEGETELGALPVWFNRHAAITTGCTTPADLDLGFWCVGSDTSFRTYLTVLHGLGVPWAVICDGAAFDLKTRRSRFPHIFDQVLNAGISAPELQEFMRRADEDRTRRMDRVVFDDARKLGEQFGIFTLARGWTTADKTNKTPGDESFETFIDAVAPSSLNQAKDEVGDSKVRKGRWLGANISCPREVADLYARMIIAFGRQGLTFGAGLRHRARSTQPTAVVS
jgi:hypothetical protein